jgi:uncharacterized protein YraI
MHQTTDLLSTPTSGRSRPGVRLYRTTTLLTVFATMFGGLLLLLAPAAAANAGESDAASGTRYVWDGALNLRSGPTTDDPIVTVMPDGAAVELTGDSANGFAGVVYNGTWGWAFAEFLTSEQGGSSWSPVPENSDEPDWVPVGDAVTGYGWVNDGPLNLRDGPSTSHTILDVMPQGAEFKIRGDIQSGFHPVEYSGTTGWAYAEFTTVNGGTTPAPSEPETVPGEGNVPAPSEPETTPGDGSVPVPGTDPVGTAMVIDGALNLRSGPSTSSSILDVMPNSAQVSLLGEPQNGFLPIRYNGVDGWAFAAYLSTGDAGTPVDPPVTTDPPAPTEPPVNTDPPGETAPPVTNDPGADGWSQEELVQLIYEMADAYGQPREDMLRVARCESVLDPSAVNSSSGASGLFQFMPGTWLQTPFAEQNIFDPAANAEAAAWMWSVGRRNEWTCQ